MIERIFVLEKPINAALREMTPNKDRDLLLSDDEVKQMKDIIDVLSCFYDATLMISGSDYPTISYIIPLMKSIKNSLENLEKDESNFKKYLKNIFLKSLNYYERKFNYSNVFLLAMTFLDPRFKKFGCFPDDEAKECINRAKSYLRTYATRFQLMETLGDSTPTPQPCAKKLQIFDFQIENIDPNKAVSNNLLTREFEEYKMIKINEEIDVLTWWFNNKKKFPILSQIVKRSYCATATSVPSEILFSASGYTIWDRRNSLSSNKVNKMMICNQFDRNEYYLNQTLKKRK
jgi:hypothetical protein